MTTGAEILPSLTATLNAAAIALYFVEKEIYIKKIKKCQKKKENKKKQVFQKNFYLPSTITISI